MPKSTTYFDEPLQDWTRRKHAILENYFPRFCKVLSSHTRGQSIWYIDGYAGAGSYQHLEDPASKKLPGSPVIAATVAQNLPYDVQCLNVEADQNVFVRLQQETAQFSCVMNINDQFTSVVDKILQQVARSQAFFFLDPFGVADLPMKGVIERIAQRSLATDILLRYDFETVRRLIGSAMKDAKRGDANALHVDNWFKGDGWRVIVENTSTSSAERDAALLKYYKQQLKSISMGRLNFVVDYPIRTTDGKVKYYLVFATGNKLGIKIMSQVLYKAESEFNTENQAYHDKKSGGQGNFFAIDAPSHEDKYIEHIQEIATSIQLVGRTKMTDWEFDNLFCEIILEHGWCGRVSEKDFRAALKHLRDEDSLERLTEGNAWSTGIEFRIKT